MSRKSQLQSSIKKFKGPLSLAEFEKLSKGLSGEILGFPDKVESWPDDERKLAEKLFKDIVYKKLSVYKTYRYDWEAGRVLPNDEELEYLKKFSKNFPSLVEFFEEEKRQSPSNADGFEQVKNESKEDKEAIDQLIKNDEYRRKAEEKLKEENKKKGRGDSSSSQLSDNDKQIASLQGKIQVLEDKLKQIPTSGSSDTSQEIQIKQQIQQLRNELKEKEKENKQSQQPSNNFPTGWVVGGGILVGILLLVIIILASKKRN